MTNQEPSCSEVLAETSGGQVTAKGSNARYWPWISDGSSWWMVKARRVFIRPREHSHRVSGPMQTCAIDGCLKGSR